MFWYHTFQGTQWLSGRELDSRLRGRGLEPHQRHCVVVLEQDTFILALIVLVQPRKTRPYITERLLMGRKESNKKKIMILFKRVNNKSAASMHSGQHLSYSHVTNQGFPLQGPYSGGSVVIFMCGGFAFGPHFVV